MARKSILVFLISIVLNGCCTKKGCIGEDLPVIEFNFSDTASLRGTRVLIKTILNNAVVDSMVITDHFDKHFTLFPFSFHGDEDGHLKSYEFNVKGRVTVIDNITCEFKKEEFKCNECFPVRIEKEFILVNENFSFRHNGQTFFEGSLLTLD